MMCDHRRRIQDIAEHDRHKSPAPPPETTARRHARARRPFVTKRPGDEESPWTPRTDKAERALSGPPAGLLAAAPQRDPFVRPVGDRVDRRRQGASLLRQRVFDPAGGCGHDGALDDPFLFELAQPIMSIKSVMSGMAAPSTANGSATSAARK